MPIIKNELLIVSEANEDRKWLIDLLSAEGYVVFAFPDCKLAAYQVQKRLPELVLLDDKIATSDVEEFCQHLKCSKNGPDLPILILRDWMSENFRSWNQLAKSVDFIGKPLQRLEVLSRIKMHVDSFGMQSASIISEHKRQDAILVKTESDLVAFNQPIQQMVGETPSVYEERFRNIFEHSMVGISLTRVDGTLQVNKTCCDMLGYTMEEMNSLTWEQITFPEDLQKTRDNILELLSGTKQKGQLQKRFLHKDGSIVWAEVSSYLHRDQSGIPLYFITTIINLTEQIIAEKALKESTDKLRLSLHVNHASVFENNFKTGTSVATSELYHLLEYSEDEVPSLLEDTFSRVHPDDVQKVKKAIDDHFSGRSDEYFAEFRFRTKSGNWRWIDGRGKVIEKDANGEPIKLLGISRDIHQRKLAEEALRESEERFRTTLYSIGDGVITTDTDGCVKIMNGVAEQLTGWTQQDAFGRLLEEVYPIIDEESREQLEIPARRVLREGVVVDMPGHSLLIGRDGSERPITNSGAPIRNSRGEIVGVVLVCRDRSNEREAERALKESEKKYRLLVEASLDAIFVIQDNQITYLNNAALKLFGYENSVEVIGKSPFDLFHPGHHNNIKVRIQKLVESRLEATSTEEKIIHRNGKVVEVEVMTTPYTINGNRAIQIVLRDITERKKLEQSRLRLLNIIENSLNEVYVFDSESLKFSYVNQGALQNLGYPAEELAQMTPFQIKPEFSESAFRNMIDPLLSGRLQKLTFETNHQRKDGTIYPVDVQLQLHRQEGKNLIFAVINDITVRKQSEKDLRESEEMFRKLAESTPISICIYQDDRWIYANPAAEQLTGFSFEELAALHIHDFVAPEYRNLVKSRATARLAGTGNNDGYEFRIIRKDGQPRWVYLKSSLISYDDRPAGLASIVDITEKKQMEDQLRQSEERFRKAIHEAPFPIMIHAEDEEVIALSRGWTEISGYSQEDIPTTGIWTEKAYGKDRTLVKSLIDSQLFGHEYWSEEGEFIIRTRNGDLRIWDFGSSSLGKLSDGRRLAISMAKDVTDRKRVEEKLLVANQKMEAFFNQSIDGFYFMSMDEPIDWSEDSDKEQLLDYAMTHQRITRINDAMLAQYGGTSEQFIGLTPEDFFAHDRAQGRDVIRQLFDRGTLHVVTEECDTKGNTIFVDGDYACLRDSDRRIVGHFGIQRDITESKRIREAMVESERKYRYLFENNPAPMWIYDATDLRFLEVNSAAVNHYGYSRDEFLTMAIKEIYADEGLEMPVQGIQSSADRITPERSCRHLKKSGELIYVDFISHDINFEGRKSKLVILNDVTERRQVQQDIEKERLLLRTLIDNLPVTIYVKDLSGRRIVSNLTDIREMGKSTEAEVLGKTDREIFNNEFGERVYADDLIVMESGRAVINREEIFTGKEGAPRWLLNSKVPLADQYGQVVGMVGIGRDITEMKRANETIQKLTKSIEQSPSSIMITDLNGFIEYVNPTFSNETGYKREEVIGRLPRILNKGKLPDEVHRQLWEDLKAGRVWRGEYQNRRKNYETYYESVVISPLTDETGSGTNLLIISENITKRKRDEKVRNIILQIAQDSSVSNNLEEMVEQIRYRLGELIDVTNFYLALYNESSNAFSLPLYRDEMDDISVFPAAKSLTAYVLHTKKSFLGTKKDIEKLKRVGLVESVGEPAEVWLGVPLIVEQEAYGVFAVQSYDNAKAFNEQDREMLEFVSHEISHLIRRMKAEQEIKLALDKAEQSDRLKSAFLANMSHEIRTPLNSIMGFSELLADAEFDEEQRQEFIGHIISSGNNLLNIINDILDISKIESGEIVIRNTEIRVKSLLDEISARYLIKVEDKSLRFICDYSLGESFPEISVFADRERLQQIFNNLLSNALKFTYSGYIALGCRILEKEIKFWVKDTGIGILPEYHEKIFERFRQVESSYKRNYGGNGLGLAITKNLVELMGGHIWLDSEPGKGSTFYFSLPIHHSDEEKRIG